MTSPFFEIVFMPTERGDSDITLSHPFYNAPELITSADSTKSKRFS